MYCRAMDAGNWDSSASTITSRRSQGERTRESPPHFDRDGPTGSGPELSLTLRPLYMTIIRSPTNSFAVHAMKARQGEEGRLDVHTNGFGNGHHLLHPHPNGSNGGPSIQRSSPSYQLASYSPYPSYQSTDPALRASSSSLPPPHSMPPPPPQPHPPPGPSTQHIPPSLMFTTHANPSPSGATDYPTPSATNGLPTASTPGRPQSSFAFSPSAFKTPGDFSWLDSILDGNATNFGGTADFLGDSSSLFATQFPSEQAHLLSLESPEHLLATGSVGGAGLGGSGSMLPPLRREPQLEDVTSWANISHYISLFLQYLYPLLPLVHRPTFAEHLATRRDLRDTDFRALLLSIGELIALLRQDRQLIDSHLCHFSATDKPPGQRPV